jgi:CubicO group peptidase (beta-lactamase class C family)
VGAFDLLSAWGASNIAIAVTDRDGITSNSKGALAHGDLDRRFRIASISKLFVAYAALIAVEEGTITLDDPAGPTGSTVRHLLAHAAGYGFTGQEAIAAVGRRRIYSNTGIEVFADYLADRSGIAFADYLREAVLEPLGMAATELRKSPAHGIHSTVNDLARFARELLAPTLVSRATLDAAVQVQFPGLAGIVPGVGRFDPCDWGLGFERNFGKSGHWSGTAFSTSAFGHFGGSGTFLVVDPTLDRAVICLTDRDYDDWALDAWPVFCEALVVELR